MIYEDVWRLQPDLKAALLTLQKKARGLSENISGVGSGGCPRHRENCTDGCRDLRRRVSSPELVMLESVRKHVKGNNLSLTGVDLSRHASQPAVSYQSVRSQHLPDRPQ